MTETKEHRHHEKQQQPHFFNGFLVGLILGFGLALLFTTKKGRKMIKALTEEGLDSISELRKRMDTIEVMIDEAEDEDYVEPKSVKNGVSEKEEKSSKQTNESEEDDGEIEKRGSKRKLFRGISRKN